MTVEKDLIKLSGKTKKYIISLAEILQKRYTEMQSIIICKTLPEFIRATTRKELELFIFLGHKSHTNICHTGHLGHLSGSVKCRGCRGVCQLDSDHDRPDIFSGNCPFYNPGMGYIQGRIHGLEIENRDRMNVDNFIPPLLRAEYLEFLQKHLKVFVKRGGAKITIINSGLMAKDNQEFYTLYLKTVQTEGCLIFDIEKSPSLFFPESV